MTISVEASIVNGSVVTPIDPAQAMFFDLLSATTAGPQIAPRSENPIPDPFSGTLLQYLDGVVIAAASNGLSGTGTAIGSGGFGLLADPSDINLSDEAMTIVFTYEQTDGSQLVVRALITAGSGPTLQEFSNGYTLEDLLTDADTVNGADYTFSPIDDDFIGSADADTFIGTDEGDEMTGAGGADTLSGRAGNDSMSGGAGNDSMSGGLGADNLRGGAGNDDMSGGAGADLLIGGKGRDTLEGGRGNDTLIGGDGPDVLTGGAGNDSMSGGDGADRLRGGIGNDDMSGGNRADLLNGGGGRDTLEGGRGNDTLIGGNGSDDIKGGAGNDRIIGGRGNDTATGGNGADRFVFNNSSVIDGQTDIITDFEVGVDVIVVGNLDYTSATFTDGASGAEISIGDYTLLLEGVSVASLSESDFDLV